MSFFRSRPMRCATLAVIATAATGCTSSAGEKQAADQGSHSEPTSRTNSVIALSSARPALEADYVADGKDGCPAISEDAQKTMFGPRHIFWHHTWNSDEAAALKCTLWYPPISPRDRSPMMHLALTRSPKLTKKAAAGGHFLFTNRHMLLRNQKLDLAGKFPGYGFATEKKTINWQCGPYHLWVRAAFTKSMPQRVLMEDLTAVVEFHAKDLCGTVSNPSPEVMNDPYAMWAIYDAFGGTSPQSYGLPRPGDMEVGQPRPLVTPRKQQPAATSESPTPAPTKPTDKQSNTAETQATPAAQNP